MGKERTEKGSQGLVAIAVATLPAVPLRGPRDTALPCALLPAITWLGPVRSNITWDYGTELVIYGFSTDNQVTVKL